MGLTVIDARELGQQLGREMASRTYDPTIRGGEQLRRKLTNSYDLAVRYLAQKLSAFPHAYQQFAFREAFATTFNTFFEETWRQRIAEGFDGKASRWNLRAQRRKLDAQDIRARAALSDELAV